MGFSFSCVFSGCWIVAWDPFCGAGSKCMVISKDFPFNSRLFGLVKIWLCFPGWVVLWKIFMFAPNPGQIIQFDFRIFFRWVGSTINFSLFVTAGEHVSFREGIKVMLFRVLSWIYPQDASGKGRFSLESLRTKSLMVTLTGVWTQVLSCMICLCTPLSSTGCYRLENMLILVCNLKKVFYKKPWRREEYHFLVSILLC